MSLLTLDISKCVHTTNKFAICNACVESCPVDTIKIHEHQLSFTPSECVGCNGCSAACPTAAYSLDDFKSINYIFSFLESGSSVLSCKEELPCIAALSVEELLSISLFSNEDMTYDIGPCKECPIAQKNLQIIKDRAEEVEFLLEAMMQEKKVLLLELEEGVSEEKAELSRRELLSKDGLKQIVSIKQQFENRVESEDSDVKAHNVSNSDIQKIREKKVPDRRSLLLMAMKRANVPEVFHVVDINDISFISQKELDESTCTNCQMCYRICPTGALNSDKRGSFINFNPMACVQCHSCHDVCEPDSLTLKKTFNLESFFKAESETLIKFDIRKCDECNNPFAYTGGEVICMRCRIEEEEAKELWGIG